MKNLSTQEIIKLKLKELANEAWAQVLKCEEGLHLRKTNKFYIDLNSCFKPIGFGYPDGDEELEYEYTYFDLAKKVSESTTYSELYSILKVEYNERFKEEENTFSSSKFDRLDYFMSTHIRLLIRNLLHYSHQNNAFQDYLGYKDSQVGDDKTYDKFWKEYSKTPSDDRAKAAISFIYQIIEKSNEVFIKDLNDIPPVYINKVFISGIKLKQDEYKISNKILLRKVKSSDEMPSSKNNFKKFAFRNQPTCLLEFESDYADISSPFGLVGSKNSLKQILLNSLKLFTLNGFKIIHEMIHPISIDKQFFSENRTDNDNLNISPFLSFEPNAEFSKEDAEHFSQIFKLVKYINERDNKEAEFIKVSLDFFIEALSKKTLSGQLTYSILSLESLYNTSNKDVTDNLRKKCSFLLSLFREIDTKLYSDFAKKAIKGDLGKGYGVRSEYVHGENPSNFSNFGLTAKIKKYTYYSILLFMQLIQQDEVEEIKNDFKQEFRTQKKVINDFIIHNALINEKYAEKLLAIVKKCNLFEPYYGYKKQV